MTIDQRKAHAKMVTQRLFQQSNMPTTTNLNLSKGKEPYVHQPYASSVPSGTPDSRTSSSFEGSTASTSHFANTRTSDFENKRQKALAALQRLNQPSTDTYQVLMISDEASDRHPPPSGGGGWGQLLAPALQEARPEKFSGYDEDWTDFTTRWDNYAELINMQHPNLPDRVWLTLLRSVLDPASALRLDNTLKWNKHTTYLEFWRELERTFGRDMAERHRREWESIAMDPHAELTLREFRQHLCLWENALCKVSGITADEAARRFLKSLPADYHEMARHEEIRRTQGQYWVRISKTGHFNIMEITAWLQEFLGYPPPVEDGEVVFLVECGSEDNQEIILSLNGVEARGYPLAISLHRKSMGYRQVAHWIEEKLRIREEIFPAPRTPVSSYKGNRSTSAHVHEVSAKPNTNLETAPTPKGNNNHNNNTSKPPTQTDKADDGEQTSQGNRNRGRSPWRGKGENRWNNRPRDSSVNSTPAGKGETQRNNEDNDYHDYNAYNNSSSNRGGRGKGSRNGEEHRPRPPSGTLQHPHKQP